jgi:hypothetical protein
LHCVADGPDQNAGSEKRFVVSDPIIQKSKLIVHVFSRTRTLLLVKKLPYIIHIV